MALTINEIEKQKAIIKIKERFSERIKDYNNKYPEEEQKRFSDKKLGAEKVIEGGTDNYIKAIAEAKGITEMEMALYIKQKANEFEQFYIQQEIERDIEISKL